MLKRRREGSYRASKRFRLKSVFCGKDAPKFDSLVIFCEKTKNYEQSETDKWTSHKHPQHGNGQILYPKDVILHKDVKVQWNKKSRKMLKRKGKDKRAFSLWFNTDFIEAENKLFFVKNEIDKVNKVKGAKDFVAVFEFEPLD